VFQHPDGKARLLALPFVDNNSGPTSGSVLAEQRPRVVEHFHTHPDWKDRQRQQFSPPRHGMGPVRFELGIGHMTYARLVSGAGTPWCWC
jgi:assimilatory nitrate reductase catalytic subunit